jgi:hypothetical protein
MGLAPPVAPTAGCWGVDAQAPGDRGAHGQADRRPASAWSASTGIVGVPGKVGVDVHPHARSSARCRIRPMPLNRPTPRVAIG